MVMEEYLSDKTNDMIVCLKRAGLVIIRCKIWKAFLTIRDGVKGNSKEFAYEKSKRKLEKSKPKFSKADGFATFSTKSTSYLDDGVQSRMILYRTPMKKRSWVLTRN